MQHSTVNVISNIQCRLLQEPASKKLTIYTTNNNMIETVERSISNILNGEVKNSCFMPDISINSFKNILIMIELSIINHTEKSLYARIFYRCCIGNKYVFI